MNSFLKVHLNELKNIFSNPELELRILLTKNSIKKKDIILSNFKMEDINIKEFNKSFQRRINKEPISKIFNNKSFWKYDFFVNKSVLDPRPETELIIEKILEFYPKKEVPLKILDMCTGSGCLAISLAKEYLKAKVTATDISSKALEIAKFNAHKLKCINQINFVECNLLKNYEIFDIVVCNPPYLSALEYSKTSLEIQLYEPKIALIASNQGFEFFSKIANILTYILGKNSRAFLEIGSKQAKETLDIFKAKKLNCLKIVKDIQKLNRVLILNKS